MDGVKEAQCAKCAHKDICKFKDFLVNAQEQINHMTITLNSEGRDGRMIKLRDIRCIECVELRCKFYMIQPSGIRGME